MRLPPGRARAFEAAGKQGCEPLSYVRLIVCVFIYAVYFVNLMKYLPTLIGGVIDMGTGVYSTVNPPKKEKGGD